MNKPIVGISGSRIINNDDVAPGYYRSYVNEDYVNTVIQNGGIPYIIPFNDNEAVTVAQVAQLDALILSGGHDVAPWNYGEESQQKIGMIWPARDRFDMRLLGQAERTRIPVLGICRGAQLINVAHGGSLYQDISYRQAPTLKHNQGHTPDLPTQTVTLHQGSHLASLFSSPTLRVNSFHHQLIKKLGQNLTAVAWAQDGVIEAFENRDASIIGVQWHPEMLHRSVQIMNNLFTDLISRAQKEGL